MTVFYQDKFNWTDEDFTNFQAFWTFCMVVGQVWLPFYLSILFSCIRQQFIQAINICD